MVLYFVRHANAGQSKPNPSKDEKRPLDKQGVEQSHAVGKALATLGVKVDAILTSPLVRARQTAEIVAGEIGQKNKISTDAAMRPDASYADFQNLLQLFVAVVGLVEGVSVAAGERAERAAEHRLSDIPVGAVAGAVPIE